MFRTMAKKASTKPSLHQDPCDFNASDLAAAQSTRANLSRWESKIARKQYVESGYKELMSVEFLSNPKYKTLMTHQKEAVAWLIESYVSMSKGEAFDDGAAREGGVLLAHDAGLGKTITVRDSRFLFLIWTPGNFCLGFRFFVFRIKKIFKTNLDIQNEFLDFCSLDHFQGLFCSPLSGIKI